MADKIKYDCFAFRSKKNENTGVEAKYCEALNELYCEKQSTCKFYLTKKQLDEKRNLIAKRNQEER